MKKLLCVLMFGMVFGQDAITTKEITIPIDENTEMIDVGNYVDLVSGFYNVQLTYANLIDTECDYWTFTGNGLSHSRGLRIESDDDDSLDVMDVVMLVDVIINGGVGDVGDLINIVRG